MQDNEQKRDKEMVILLREVNRHFGQLQAHRWEIREPQQAQGNHLLQQQLPSSSMASRVSIEVNQNLHSQSDQGVVDENQQEVDIELKLY